MCRVLSVRPGTPRALGHGKKAPRQARAEPSVAAGRARPSPSPRGIRAGDPLPPPTRGHIPVRAWDLLLPRAERHAFATRTHPAPVAPAPRRWHLQVLAERPPHRALRRTSTHVTPKHPLTPLSPARPRLCTYRSRRAGPGPKKQRTHVPRARVQPRPPERAPRVPLPLLPGGGAAPPHPRSFTGAVLDEDVYYFTGLFCEIILFTSITYASENHSG